MKTENQPVTGIDRYCPARVVGSGTPHHFFGYYNKSTWDQSGRYLLSNQVKMMTGDLDGTQVCSIGYFDLSDNDRFYDIGHTSTWNWQMGCQLQWIESKNQRSIIYNSRAENDCGVYPGFGSVIHDTASGEDRSLPLPIYVIAPSGDYALCVDYSRFQVTHKTIGYRRSGAGPELEAAPARDGIHYMDLATGDSSLIVSLRQLTEYEPLKSMVNACRSRTAS